MIMNMIKKTFFLLPSSKFLSYSWNYGSMLGMVLGLQLLTGIFLVFYYGGSMPFDDVQYIMYEVTGGWVVRCLHFNGASLFFIFIYCHLFKGLFVGGYRLYGVWFVGVIMIFLFMGVAFMGYVLVFSQMSYWAAVVITSLVTVVPIWGESVVFWLWGSYSVVVSTVKLLFVLHFLLPWVGAVLVMMHLLVLHFFGSSSVLGCHSDYDKIMFFPSFWFKDGVNMMFFLVFAWSFLLWPFVLGDGEMFLVSDIMTSPRHIVPEWYFLYAYAILRAVPSKIMGVLFLILSVGILFILGVVRSNMMFNVSSKIVYVFLFSGICLTWLGSCAPESPYVILSVVMTYIYFSMIFFLFSMAWVTKMIYY
uniref:Cytochrome b n=1 Tax=Hammerschmidtiella sp. ZengetLiu-2016 TaxID=2025463 RepID=A0A3Q8AZA4_9BILA|nr:cytochrome b [Hammerschmidtiella sp. ZengetLiu-2016]